MSAVLLARLHSRQDLQGTVLFLDPFSLFPPLSLFLPFFFLVCGVFISSHSGTKCRLDSSDELGRLHY